MEAVFSTFLSEGGLLGAVSVALLIGNIVQYRDKERLHEETRKNDRETIEEICRAISVLESVQKSKGL